MGDLHRDRFAGKAPIAKYQVASVLRWNYNGLKLGANKMFHAVCVAAYNGLRGLCDRSLKNLISSWRRSLSKMRLLQQM